MRVLVGAFALLALTLTACGTPRPFEHSEDDATEVYRPGREKTEISIAPPTYMPHDMGVRLAAALAVELQSYGVLAVVQPDRAPMRLAGIMSTRDAGQGIEVEIAWYVDRGNGTPIGPGVSKTRTTPEDYVEANDKLISRIAQQAAPRVATLMGRPPEVQPNAPGQAAAGVSVAEPVDPAVAAAAASVINGAGATPVPPPGSAPGATAAPPPQAPQLKVRVAPVTGAPSDGNKQLFSGMRRALGSSKIVVTDKSGPDTFIVVGSVVLTPMDDRRAKLTVKWVLQDPDGKQVGDLEQSNVVQLAATRGSWNGFGDVVAAAAAEGVLQLLQKALSAQH
jgi:hypothetical protein